MDKTLVIRTRLEHDNDFLVKCLLKLYELQEEDEQDMADTHHDNGKGFNRADANALTIVAKYYLVTDCPMELAEGSDVRKRMLKYAGQLAKILTWKEIDT